VTLVRTLYLKTPERLRHAVGEALPKGLQRRVRGVVGPTEWATPDEPLERNPSWNSIPTEYWVELEDGEDYNFRSQELLVAYLDRVLTRRVSLLDTACGNGRLYRGLAAAGLLDRIDYRGSDFTPHLVEAARTLNPGVPFDEASIEELPYEDGSFDVVVAQHVIQYLEYYDVAVRELLRVSRWMVVIVVKGIGEGEDRLGTYFNQRHQRFFRANMYDPDRLKAFARSEGASLAFTLNDARFDDPGGQHLYVFFT
jgi:SAM-dependent methyltransferase